MSLKTAALHEAFLRPFGVNGRLLTDPRVKPALVDLDLPHPPAVLRLPGQEVNEYASFDHSGGL